MLTLASRAVPAAMQALDPARTPGRTQPLVLAPKRVHALGLTYAAHINETGSEAGGPAVFAKDASSLLVQGDSVASPSRDAMLAAVAKLDAALSSRVALRFPALPPLLDYEVELGLVLLEDVRADALERPDFAPPVGYFLANDVTARTVQVLGEGRDVPAAHRERRDLDRKDPQPMQQVDAEGAAPHGVPEIAIGGGDDAHVDVHGSPRAERHDLAFLEDT